jgi:Zn/Cd-binding protein ZinT
MAKKQYWKGMAAVLLTFGLVLAGCASSPDKSEPELAQWEGTYNSLSSYLDEPAFAGIFADKAAAKAELAGYLATDFASLKVEGDTLTFYAAPNAGGAATAISYSLKQTIETEYGAWYAFESNRNDQYQYLLATLPGQDDPEGALHFHFRYGASGFDALLAAGNLPTAVKAGTPTDKVQEVLEEFFGRFASPERWEGTYNSLSSYLDEPAFEGFFADKADAKAVLAAFLATDFASLSGKGGSFILYTAQNAGGSSATAISYTLKRTIETEQGAWYAFESNRNDQYKYLLATLPHQDDPEAALHFHFRYGDSDFDTLLAAGNLPTAVKAGTPIDKVQEVLEEFLAYIASL